MFALNAFAFLLMGLQGRRIVTHMAPAHLRGSLLFAGSIVLGFDRLNAWWAKLRRRPRPDSFRRAVFEGSTGMRGFVTALP